MNFLATVGQKDGSWFLYDSGPHTVLQLFFTGTCHTSAYVKPLKQKTQLKPHGCYTTLHAVEPSTQLAFQNRNKGTFVLFPEWLQSIFKNIFKTRLC